jgi:prepilin peptidase CpaA
VIPSSALAVAQNVVTHYSFLFFALAALIAAAVDYQTTKIPNVITVPILFFGLAYGFYTNGMNGLVNGVLGILVAFALFFPLFILKVMGAGDGKMAMALGAYLGWSLTIKFILMALIAGGISSLLIVVLNGRYKKLFEELYLFLRSIFTPNLAIHWPKLDSASKGPFGIALFVGFVLTRYSP